MAFACRELAQGDQHTLVFRRYGPVALPHPTLLPYHPWGSTRTKSSNRRAILSGRRLTTHEAHTPAAIGFLPTYTAARDHARLRDARFGLQLLRGCLPAPRSRVPLSWNDRSLWPDGAMPFQVALSHTALRLSLSGHISRQELHALLTAMETIELESNPVPDRITDLSGISDAEITMDDMRQVVSRRLAAHFPNSFRSAIVAAEEFQLGYARMFQILNDHPSIAIRIFRSLPEAELWLVQERSTGSRAHNRDPLDTSGHQGP